MLLLGLKPVLDSGGAQFTMNGTFLVLRDKGLRQREFLYQQC